MVLANEKLVSTMSSAAMTPYKPTCIGWCGELSRISFWFKSFICAHMWPTCPGNSAFKSDSFNQVVTTDLYELRLARLMVTLAVGVRG